MWENGQLDVAAVRGVGACSRATPNDVQRGGSGGTETRQLIVGICEDGQSDAFREGASVQIVGLQSRGDLNGQVGKLIRWDKKSERRIVSIRCEAPIKCKAENLAIADPVVTASVDDSSKSHSASRNTSKVIEPISFASCQGEASTRSLMPGAVVRFGKLEAVLLTQDKTSGIWTLLGLDGRVRHTSEDTLVLENLFFEDTCFPPVDLVPAHLWKEELSELIDSMLAQPAPFFALVKGSIDAAGGNLAPPIPQRSLELLQDMLE